MSESQEFDLGRAHGRNGAGWTTNETEAYRQGRIAGAIERQNDLLQQQARKEQDARDEQARLSAIEDERQDRAEFEARRAIESQEEAERSKHEHYRVRALSLVRAMERLAPKAKNDDLLFERDAFFFACDQARRLSASDYGEARLLKEACQAAAKLTSKRPPRMPQVFVKLCDTLIQLRRQVAQSGLVLPFDREYSSLVPANSNTDKGPVFRGRFYGMTLPTWLENGDGTNLVLETGGVDVDIDVDAIRAGLSQDKGRLSERFQAFLQLRQHAIDVDRLGLWDIEPDLLDWETPFPAPNDLTTSQLVDLVASHREMLQELAASDDLEQWFERWVATPNEQVADGLMHIASQRKALSEWIESDDANWFVPEEYPGNSNGLIALSSAQSQFRAELLELRNIAGPMCSREIAGVLAEEWGDKDVQRVLEKCRTLRHKTRDEDIFKAAVGEAYRSKEARWNRVEQRFARAFCSLMGPSSETSLSIREMLMFAAGFFGLGIAFAFFGAPFIGLMLMGAAVLTGKLAWNRATNSVDEYSQHTVDVRRKALALAPQMSDIEKLRLWRDVNGVTGKQSV